MGFSLLTFPIANSGFIKHSCNPRLLGMRELTADVAAGPLEIQPSKNFEGEEKKRNETEDWS